MNIHLLCSLSIEQPLLVAELKSGIEFGLDEEDILEHTFLSVKSGKNDYLEAAQRLFLDGNSQLLVYANRETLLAIEELAKKFNQDPLLIDSCTNYTNEALKGSPNNWVQMHLGLAIFALGKLLSKNRYEQIIVFSDFYHAGYPFERYLLFGMNYSNDQKLERLIAQDRVESQLSELMEFVKQNKQTLLYLNMSIEETKKVLNSFLGVEVDQLPQRVILNSVVYTDVINSDEYKDLPLLGVDTNDEIKGSHKVNTKERSHFFKMGFKVANKAKGKKSDKIPTSFIKHSPKTSESFELSTDEIEDFLNSDHQEFSGWTNAYMVY